MENLIDTNMEYARDAITGLIDFGYSAREVVEVFEWQGYDLTGIMPMSVSYGDHQDYQKPDSSIFDNPNAMAMMDTIGCVEWDVEDMRGAYITLGGNAD